MGSYCKNKISSKNAVPEDSMPSCNFDTPSITSRKRKPQYIINVPVEQFKRFSETDGINSLSKETQQFVGPILFTLL